MTDRERPGNGRMTYCCGILVRDGLVMIADTRTNAGLDNVSTFRKLHVFGIPGERILALASSGNLGLSQSVVSTLNEGLTHPHTDMVETLLNAPTMFQAAQRIGRAIRQIHVRQADSRPRHHPRHRSLRRAEDRADLYGFDHAVEYRCRYAHRPDRGAARHLHGRARLPHRAGRAVFPRSARALVGGLARRPQSHSAAALQDADVTAASSPD